MYDNTSATNFTNNYIHHSREKHIKISNHFIKDHVQKGYVCSEFFDTDHQWADIFKKVLPEDKFKTICEKINFCFLDGWLFRIF